MSELLSKSGNHRIKKISDLIFQIEKDESKGMKVPVTIYASDSLISKMTNDRTLDQAGNVATLPGVVKQVVVLPDGHEGYGFPVGGVAATDMYEGVVSPGGVGYDINCGVRLIKTSLSESDLRPHLKELVNELFRSIPTGVGSEGAFKLTGSELDELLVEGTNWAIKHGYGWQQDKDSCEEAGKMLGADPTRVSEVAKKRGSIQLGSLGSGNHFLEIQKVNKIYDPVAANSMGLKHEGQITILIHCGSRGFGHQVCSDYLRISELASKKYGFRLADRELACVPNRSPEGDDYRSAMFSALNFAWCNRQMITHWTRKAFERIFKTNDQALGMELVYDISHNIAKVERHRVDGEGIRELVVHRKGATRAFPAQMSELPARYYNVGQPVIIPGSMGTASWVLKGNQKSMNLSLGSTAHGAGRMMSRSAAKRIHSLEEVRKTLEIKGIYIKSATRDGIVEEAPDSYKDVDEVVNVSDSLGIATKVARLVPVGVIKG